MKILHVFHHSNLLNGVDKTTCILITALQKRGLAPVAVVPAFGDVTEFLTSINVPFDVIPYSCCISPTWRAQLRFLADTSSQRPDLKASIEKHKPDLIHLNTGHLFHAGLVAAQCNIPTIWHIHAPFDNDLKRYQSAIGTGGYRWILENLSSQIIGVSNDVTESLRKNISSDHIQTLHNGVDIDALQSASLESSTSIRDELNLPLDSKLVLGVGRISAQKDFASFARVANISRKTDDKLFFIIAGPEEGPEAVNLLKDEINRLNLSKIVFILGPRRDVPSLIAQCDIFLSTAIFEGHPIATLEVMALQKPVVAMACQGLRECLENEVGGLLVEPYDEAGAAHCIIRLIKDHALSKTISARGYEFVSNNFSSEIYTHEFLNIAETTINTGPASASNDELEMIGGLLAEINKAHRRLLTFEQQTIAQRFKNLMWHILHPT